MIAGGESLLPPIKVGRKRDLFITHDAFPKYSTCGEMVYLLPEKKGIKEAV